MDYGDLIRLVIFGFIFLSFFGGLFGKKDKQKQEAPVRPTEVSQSGGSERPAAEPRPRQQPQPIPPTVMPGAGDWMPVLTERYEENTSRDAVADSEQQILERDITDMPAIGEDLYPEQRARPQRREIRKRRRIVEGGDVLRRSLKDPAALERGFIVKEVLDAPLALRNDR